MIELIGDEKYGGWHTETEGLNPASIVYSFGVGENISWDLGIIEKFKCNVYAFDPTSDSVRWLASEKVPEQFKFTPVGLGTHDGSLKFKFKEGKSDMSAFHFRKFGGLEKTIELPVKTLQTLMRERGHDRIDILKIDIEGSEYDVLPRILALDIRQILVETHERFFVGWKGLKTLYGAFRTRRLLRKLQEAGFEIAHAESIPGSSRDKDYLFLGKVRQ